MTFYYFLFLFFVVWKGNALIMVFCQFFGLFLGGAESGGRGERRKQEIKKKMNFVKIGFLLIFYFIFFYFLFSHIILFKLRREEKFKKKRQKHLVLNQAFPLLCFLPQPFLKQTNHYH